MDTKENYNFIHGYEAESIIINCSITKNGKLLVYTQKNGQLVFVCPRKDPKLCKL